jgi:hypothetical protein
LINVDFPTPVCPSNNIFISWSSGQFGFALRQDSFFRLDLFVAIASENTKMGNLLLIPIIKKGQDVPSKKE